MKAGVKRKPIWSRFLSLILSGVLLFAQPAMVMAAEPESSTPPQTSGTTSSDTPPAAPSTDPSPAPAPAPAPAPEPAPAPSPAPTSSEGSTRGPSEPTGPQTPTGPTGPVGPSQETRTPPAYAFNDATRKWVPTVTSSFTWNSGLGRYESPLYSYDARVGWYHVIPGATSGPTAASSPLALASTPGVQGSLESSAATLASLLGLGDLSNGNTGPNSINSISGSSSSSTLLEALTRALVTNNSTSNAATGNASVTGNTLAGDATSGPATIVENLLNLLNAAWSWANGGLSYFAQNLFGDHYGDIMLNPTSASGQGGQLGSYTAGGGSAGNSNTGPNSTNEIGLGSDNNLTVVNRTDGTINNNLNLLATSGDATVARNNSAGNATSGDASVEVNILNLINSAINAGESFFGMLNIFGNLNGDVLFPEGFLNGVAGAPATTTSGNTTITNNGTGPGSTNSVSANNNSNLSVVNSPTAAFNNNINSAAQSGTANVDGNTVAGSAQSGSATTKNNLFNLFNSNIAGDNAVLVLVNVMGRWVGHIMTLPDAGGSTGALLTGNASLQNTNTGPGSTNSIESNQDNTVSITNSPTGRINNNINAGAISGNAAVTGNTRAGNATSGDASVATNVANIFGSQFNLNKWFGVLVVNVFGDWTGSVADDTSAGENPAAPTQRSSVENSQNNVRASAGNSSYESVGSASDNTSSTGGGATINRRNSTPNVASTTRANNVANAIVASAKSNYDNAKSATKMTGWLILLAALSMTMAGAAMTLRRRIGH